jgi:hypothetical protein
MNGWQQSAGKGNNNNKHAYAGIPVIVLHI